MEPDIFAYSPEFLYACRRFERFFRQVLNTIEHQRKAFLQHKQIELRLLTENSHLGLTLAHARSGKGRGERTVARKVTQEDILEQLKKDYQVYSEQLYTTTKNLLLTEAESVRTEALDHYRERTRGDDYQILEFSKALDQMLSTSTINGTASQPFQSPFYHEGFSRLNPIDLTK